MKRDTGTGELVNLLFHVFNSLSHTHTQTQTNKQINKQVNCSGSSPSLTLTDIFEETLGISAVSRGFPLGSLLIMGSGREVEVPSEASFLSWSVSVIARYLSYTTGRSWLLRYCIRRLSFVPRSHSSPHSPSRCISLSLSLSLPSLLFRSSSNCPTVQDSQLLLFVLIFTMLSRWTF